MKMIIFSAESFVCQTCVVQHNRPDLCILCSFQQAQVQIQQQSQEIQQLREQLLVAQSQWLFVCQLHNKLFCQSSLCKCVGLAHPKVKYSARNIFFRGGTRILFISNIYFFISLLRLRHYIFPQVVNLRQESLSHSSLKARN